MSKNPKWRQLELNFPGFIVVDDPLEEADKILDESSRKRVVNWFTELFVKRSNEARQFSSEHSKQSLPMDQNTPIDGTM